jgi:hypothetical protein
VRSSSTNNNTTPSSIPPTNDIANGNYNNISINSTHPVTPLLAERSRNIDLDSIQHAPTSLPTPPPSPPPAMDNYSSSNIVNLDIQAIAEKVYQILHDKIKIQRARRGIR